MREGEPAGHRGEFTRGEDPRRVRIAAVGLSARFGARRLQRSELRFGGLRVPACASYPVVLPPSPIKLPRCGCGARARCSSVRFRHAAVVLRAPGWVLAVSSVSSRASIFRPSSLQAMSSAAIWYPCCGFRRGRGSWRCGRSGAGLRPEPVIEIAAQPPFGLGQGARLGLERKCSRSRSQCLWVTSMVSSGGLRGSSGRCWVRAILPGSARRRSSPAAPRQASAGRCHSLRPARSPG